MKRELTRAAVIGTTFLILSGAALAAGKAACDGCDEPCACRDEMPAGEGRISRMAKELGLNAAQKDQIKAIFKAEHEKNAPLREKATGLRKQLHDAAHAGTFDEEAARSLASSLAQVESELILERTRAASQVNAVLTPEQRTKRDALGAKVKRGAGRGRGPAAR